MFYNGKDFYVSTPMKHNLTFIYCDKCYTSDSTKAENPWMFNRNSEVQNEILTEISNLYKSIKKQYNKNFLFLLKSLKKSHGNWILRIIDNQEWYFVASKVKQLKLNIACSY